jgi:hypothetical protein
MLSCRMLQLIFVLLRGVFAGFRSGRDIALENLVLRHQLQVALQTNPIPRLGKPDRVLWIWLRQPWPSWREHLRRVEPIKAFGEKLVAAQQGAFKAKQLWFVSDGDLALKQLRKDYFPTAIYFLDIWHLQDRLAGAMGTRWLLLSSAAS